MQTSLEMSERMKRMKADNKTDNFMKFVIFESSI